MSNLQSFADYISQCISVVTATETRLLDLQSRYEAFFQEVCTVREHELAQLAHEIYRRRGALPEGLDGILAQAKEKAEKDFDEQLAALEGRHAELVEQAEGVHKSSLDLEVEAHQRNMDLDAQEEALKSRNELLLQGIAQYNERIRQMGSGFGFLVNLFDMRSLQAERARLDEEQATVAAHIEALRARWTKREKEYCAEQEKLQAAWTKTRTQADTVQTKIDHLLSTRAEVVERTALERVLFERYPAQPSQGTGAACPRCGLGNPPTHRFCQYCALRLLQDRPDLEGSLPEIAELNHHHRRFSSGMKSCQELIALVGGLRSGLLAFLKSVSSMISNENRYPLPKLQIRVPGECIEYSKNFHGLQVAVETRVAHPVELAQTVKQATAMFGPKELQGYFERMGQELSVQAKAQWG
jgi:predicted  nucleic acid-binding Zn-ribbon protein